MAPDLQLWLGCQSRVIVGDHAGGLCSQALHGVPDIGHGVEDRVDGRRIARLSFRHAFATAADVFLR